MDAEGKANAAHGGDDRRAAVGHEQKRDACNRHDAHGHANVDEKVENVHCRQAGGYVGAKSIGRELYNPQKPETNQQKKSENNHAAPEPPLLSENRENKISALLRHKTVMALGSL